MREEPETVPPAVEKQCSVAAKDNQLEPEEVQSSEESSDGWVKVEFSKEEELKKISIYIIHSLYMAITSLIKSKRSNILSQYFLNNLNSTAA
ncbi:hypothetical protein HN51_046242 [Arachis hypogaea]